MSRYMGGVDTGIAKAPRRSHRRPDGLSYVYFIRAMTLGHIKIGWALCPFSRLATLQIACPDELELLGVIVTDDAATTEGHYHQRFIAHRIRGEWFRGAPELLACIRADAKPWALIDG